MYTSILEGFFPGKGVLSLFWGFSPRKRAITPILGGFSPEKGDVSPFWGFSPRKRVITPILGGFPPEKSKIALILGEGFPCMGGFHPL